MSNENSRTARIDSFARLLIEARTSGEPLDSVPPSFVPESFEEAQLVDDRVAELSGWPVAGWKIGCTSEHAQKLLGAPGPFAGRVYSVHESGAVLSDDDLMVEPRLEGEIAFELIEPIAAGAAADRETVIDAVGAIAPAIEFVGGRFTGFPGTPLLLVVADAGSNSLLVLGDRVDDVDLEDLGAANVQMMVGDEVTGEGRGSDVLGHPLNALMWLVEHLGGRGIDLDAGQVITTGTATQVSKLPVGSLATATIESIGSVTVTHGRS
ncbi:MAG: hypothetical protein GY708_18195 [Actinomycetia bacterium]|nr:hypothetical protein [Actinomycetes bacterium]